MEMERAFFAGLVVVEESSDMMVSCLTKRECLSGCPLLVVLTDPYIYLAGKGTKRGVMISLTLRMG